MEKLSEYYNYLADFIYKRLILILLIQFPVIDVFNSYMPVKGLNTPMTILYISITLLITFLLSALIYPIYRLVVDHIKRQL